MTLPSLHRIFKSRSFLAWPAWLRVLLVSPFVAFLWAAVMWAGSDFATR